MLFLLAKRKYLEMSCWFLMMALLYCTPNEHSFSCNYVVGAQESTVSHDTYDKFRWTKSGENIQFANATGAWTLISGTWYHIDYRTYVDWSHRELCDNKSDVSRDDCPNVRGECRPTSLRPSFANQIPTSASSFCRAFFSH